MKILQKNIPDTGDMYNSEEGNKRVKGNHKCDNTY